MRLVLAFNVIHPAVVTLLANTLYTCLWIVHPFTSRLSDFDMYRFRGLEVFQNPVRPDMFRTVNRIRAEQALFRH